MSTVKFISLEPFVPSGPDIEKSKQLFQAIGFTVNWDVGDYIGLENNGCKFILQKFDKREFAENFMLSVQIPNADDFYKMILEKKIPEKFGIRINPPDQQPYGKEVNIIDLAGVCWHFVE